MLTPLNKIAEQQADPTQNTEAEITFLLEYADTNPNAIVQYKAIDMVLHIYSDESYLSEPRARSCNGGQYYLILLPSDPTKAPNHPPPSNVPIHTEFRILRHMVASAAKAKVRGFLQNWQTYVLLRITIN